MSSPPVYIELCIPAPAEGLSGALVAAWIEQLLGRLPLDWVAATDVDVAGGVRSELLLSAQEIRVARCAEFVAQLCRAEQVVWASLFFCSSPEAAAKIRPDETYQSSTKKALLAVRIVDASYFYVIGAESTVRGLVPVLPQGDLRVSSLEELEFPE